MSFVKDHLQNSIIERLILRYAGPFLSNIEIKSNIKQGTIYITNLKQKENSCFFETVEQLLVKLGADVWGVNGMVMIWPHGVEITSAVIRHIEIKVPYPNPFNGDMWKITVDGVDGEIRTLTSERKAEITRNARRKALEEADKRLKSANSQPASRPVSPIGSREESQQLLTRPSNPPAADSDEDDDEADSEGGLAKAIDKYFKTHLDISFNNNHIVMHTVEDEETPEACWDITVGCVAMNLGVGEVHLEPFHRKAVTNVLPTCKWGRGTPPDVKLFEEKIGLTFSAIKFNFFRSRKEPPVMVLHFPEKMMNLHLVRRQWPETNTTQPNGYDRINVELPDDFEVKLHFDQVAIRGVIIRALHQILDGVAINVPNWVDWISCPCPNGWTRAGKPTPPKEDPDALMKEYLALLGKRVSNQSSGNKLWEFLGFGSCRSGCSNETSGNGFFSQMAPLSGEKSNAFDDNERIEWFEATQSTEWLAYCQHLPDSVSAPGLLPENDRPLTTWLVVPWRRYEVTMQFDASFKVDITSGEKREQRMAIDFPAGMAVVMVRDSPAEWTITASIPGLLIASAGSRWLDLGHIAMQLNWGRRELLDKRHAEKLPEEVPSVCRLAYLQVSGVDVKIDPAMAINLLPMLAEVPEVALWPELHYFFGEWGYMPRPMAYVLDIISIKDIHVQVASEAFIPTEEKKYPNAHLSISVTTVDLSSDKEPIYVDNNWQAWWSLNVHVGDTNISAHLRSLNQPVFTATAIGIKTARKARLQPAHHSLTTPTEETHVKPVCATDVHLMTASITASPDAMLCFTKLAMTYMSQCKGLVKPMARSGAAVFYKICKRVPPDVPELPSWIWPCTFQVECDEVQPLFIAVKHSMSKVAQIKVSFKLMAVLQQQVMAVDAPFLVVSMNPARVCIECFDEDGSEAWEPLLEAWHFEMGIQLHLPPKPRLMVLLTSHKGVELNVTSTLVMVGRSLFFAYAPLVKAAIDNGVPSEAFSTYLAKKESMSHMAALNLTGTTIMAQLVTLPRTATQVAVKMQAIFRARRDRRRVKEMGYKTPGSSPAGQLRTYKSDASMASIYSTNTLAPWAVVPTDVEAPKSKKARKKTSKKLREHHLLTKKGVVLRPGDNHALSMCDNSRLSISMKYLPRDLPPSPSSPDKPGKPSSFRRVLPKGVTGSLTKIRRHSDNALTKVCSCFRGQQAPASNTTSTARQVSPPNRYASGVGSDAARLMNICRHGQTAIIPASDGKTVAYIGEVISPSVNDRMLMVQSPLRIFNYTSAVIDICFTDGIYPLDVSDEIVEGCTYAAEVLGQEQPVDPNPYGLAAADLKLAKSKDQQSWRLPSNCFASVPPRLRHPGGGLAIRARSGTCKNWETTTYDIDKLEGGDEVLYRFPNGDTVRIYYKTRVRFETALIVATGQRVTCCDICFVPSLSILSMCPLPLEVHLDADFHSKQETVLLEPGKAKNFYRHVDVNIKLRFAGSDHWSHTLKNIDARENHEKEDLVTLPASNGLASTEVFLKQMRETCIISSPLWFVDKTNLGLRCTDKKGQEFPRAGPFYLPASQHETILVLSPSSLSTSSVTKQSHKEARESLPKQFFRKSSCNVLMHTESQSFPLKISSKHLDHMFGEFQEGHVPPAQLLTIVPALMFASTLPLSVRFNGGEPQPIPADEAIPIWPQVSGRTPHTLDDHQVEFQVDEHSGWSKPIKCSHSLTGVYSLAMAPVSYRASSSASIISRRSTDAAKGPAVPLGPVRTLSVEISDSFDNVLAFHISDKSDECWNRSSMVDTAFIETDSIEEPSSRGLFFSSRASDASGNQQQEPSPWAFKCKSDERVGIGWFLPFAKDKTDDVHIWLQWAGDQTPRGPFTINLHSTIIYVFLRPASESKGRTTVAKVRQHKQRRCLEIYDEDDIKSQAGYHAEEICGVCGTSLGEESEAANSATGVSDLVFGAVKSIGGLAQQVGTNPVNLLGGAVNDPVFSRKVGGEEDNDASKDGPEMGHTTTTGSTFKGIRRTTAAGTITCKNCESVLAVPGFEDLTSNTDAVMEKEHMIRKFDNLQNAAKTPMKTLLSALRWIGALEINCNLRIPFAGISVISKKNRREVLYFLAEGIMITFQAPDGMNTHVMQLQLQGARCDRFDVQIGHKSPCILNSTMVIPKGKDSVDPTPAVDVTIVREYVTAFNIFIRETTANLYHTWEVDLDTALLNDLFEIGDECTKALGPMAKHLFMSLGQAEELSPSLVFERLQQMGEEPLDFLWRRAGRVIQLENFTASDINVKIWLKLKLADLKFVPAEVRRFLYWFGVLMMPSLNASKLHIDRKSESEIRGSIIEVGKAFVRLYRNDFARVVRTLLGSTRLTHGHEHTESGLANLQKALGFSTKSISTEKGDKTDGVEEIMVTGEILEAEVAQAAVNAAEALPTLVLKAPALALLNEKRKASSSATEFKRTAVTVPSDHPDPACTGQSWLRLPRLLMARARVIDYDEFHAEVLQACGPELLEDCLQIFKLRQEPLELLIATVEQLTIGELVARHLNDAKGGKHTFATKGQWPWDKIKQVNLPNEQEIELVTLDARDNEVVKRLSCSMSKGEKNMLVHIVRKFDRKEIPTSDSAFKTQASSLQASSQGAGEDSAKHVAV